MPAGAPGGAVLGVELAAALLRRPVHLARAVVADGRGCKAAGRWAGASASAKRRHSLHVVPHKRPVRTRSASGRLPEARAGGDVRAEALARAAAAQLRQHVREEALRLGAGAGQVGGDGVPDGVVAHDA